MELNQGIVCVFTNAAMPELVKIDKTVRADAKTRMNELYISGVPVLKASKKVFFNSWPEKKIVPQNVLPRKSAASTQF